MKGILKSTMVLVLTMLILLIPGAFFSGGIVSAHAAFDASHVIQQTPSTTPHALATQPARPGERSSPATGGGKLLWRYLMNGTYSSPAVVNGVVYVGSGDGYVYALNASSGTLLWNYLTGSGGNGVDSSPAVVKGVVYVGAGDGYVYALNASSGIPRWRYQAANVVDSSPAVVKGVVYVCSIDGSVYALTA